MLKTWHKDAETYYNQSGMDLEHIFNEMVATSENYATVRVSAAWESCWFCCCCFCATNLMGSRDGGMWPTSSSLLPPTSPCLPSSAEHTARQGGAAPTAEDDWQCEVGI